MSSPSSAKTKAAALRRLQAEAKGQPVTAQVFLSDAVEECDIAALAHDIIGPMDAKLGKVHTMAKSFSVTAKPEVLERIAESPEVRSVMPNEIADILPKPVRKRQL